MLSLRDTIHKLRNLCRLCITAILSEKYPIIITFIVASLGTYVVAPHINKNFEKQKMQATYVLDNLHQFNELISDLHMQVTSINYDVAEKGEASPDNIRAARQDISKLNWKIVEIASVLKRKEDIELLLKFKKSISDINEILDKKLTPSSCLRLIDRMQIMAKNASLVINAVSNNVSL